MTPVVSLGENQREMIKAQKLFRVLYKLMVHLEARLLVIHESYKDVWKAWRALDAKRDPQIDAAATRTVIRLVDASYWKVSHVDEVPVTLAKREALEQERQWKTGETVLSPALKREIFLDMLPAAMRSQMEISTLMMPRRSASIGFASTC